MQASPYYPYPPRPGIGLEDVSLQVEHAVLNDEETEAVLAFEHDLYDLKLNADRFPTAASFQAEQASLGSPLQPLEIVWDLKVHSSELGVNYFMTEAGRAAARDSLGVELGAETTEEMTAALAALDTSAVESKILDKLENDSVGYEQKLLVDKFSEDGYSGKNVPAPQIVTVYKNPEVLVTKARGFRQLKTYLRHVKADVAARNIDGGDAAIGAAETVLVDKYRQRINVFLAYNYVSAHKLLAQHWASGESAHAGVIAELQETLPAFSSQSEPMRIAGLLQRFDRYLNGVAVADDGTFTWLSSPARTLATGTNLAETTAANRTVYADLEPEVLATTTIDSATFGRLLSGVLQEYGLYSSIEDWSSERHGPASDSKWQVIVDGMFKSLKVNDKQRVVQVPDKLISLLDAISVGNHELTHVLQHENKRALGKLAILKRIGFDFPSEQTEAGGLWQEQVARQDLSGEVSHSISGVGYYKSLEIKARGGSFGECVEAYYEEVRQRDPKKKIDVAAAEAVNRARRIFRSGGFEFAKDNTYLTNTQPLNYLEQQLIYEGLNDDTRKYLLVGGISIANLVELSRYGLVDTDNIHIPDSMPWQVMYPAVKELLDAEPAS